MTALSKYGFKPVNLFWGYCSDFLTSDMEGSKMVPIALLSKVPIFNSLNEQKLHKLAALAYKFSVKQGQIIFNKGDEGTALYVLGSGAVKLVFPSQLGTEIIISIFSEGDFFGEMALLDREPRDANAVAIKDSELITLRRTDFLSFLQSDIVTVRSILSAVTNRLRKTQRFAEDVCFLSISERLTKLILKLGKIYGRWEGETLVIDLFLTQKELGDMIGATRESINKELKVLRKKGLIAYVGNHIKICDWSQLNRHAHAY